MGDRHPFDSLPTPLISSRTLQSAAASAGGSRLPLRRGSVSGLNGGSGLLSSTAPRLGGTLRSASTATTAAPATASRIGTLKRTSVAAGLAQDNELSTTKRALARALHDLEEANHAAARKQLDFDSQLSALNAQLTEAHARTDRLERHRSLLLAKERADADAAAATRTELEAARAAALDDARRAREECSALRDKHARLGERERELAHRTRQAELEASSAVGRVAGLEDALEAERAAVRERSAQLAKEQAARRELEIKLSAAELAKPAEGGNVELIKDELHRQVGYLRTLEKENQRLTRKVELMDKNQANVEVLREENKALERKVRYVEELRHQVAELEMQLQVAEREKREWQSFLGSPGSTAEFNTPQQLAKALAATRIESASYLERVDSLKLELGTRDRLVGQLEATIFGLEDEIAKATKDAESARGREKAAEQRMELLRQEIAMLKRHLDSYAAEESIHQAGNFDEQKSARLIELEQLLEAHKAEEVRLAGQVSHYRAVAEKFGGTTGEIEVRERNEGAAGGAVSESLKALLEKNAQLEQEIADLIQENESLNQDLEALEAQLSDLAVLRAQGHFDTSTTKCFQLADNPESLDRQLRANTLAQLKAENVALVDRIAVLEKRAGLAGADGLVPKESWERLKTEVDRLEKTLSDKEKMAVRLKESYTSKSEDVRRAVRLLLGYDIALQEGGRIRLISMYAPSKDRSLAFQPVREPGALMPFELMTALEEDDGVGGLGRGEVQMNGEVWLGQRRSLPGFLASLTLTLWEAKEGATVGR